MELNCILCFDAVEKRLTDAGGQPINEFTVFFTDDRLVKRCRGLGVSEGERGAYPPPPPWGVVTDLPASQSGAVEVEEKNNNVPFFQTEFGRMFRRFCAGANWNSAPDAESPVATEEKGSRDFCT